MLFSAGFISKTKAQCFDYVWTNNSDCQWQVDFWDNSTPPLGVAGASFTITAAASPPTNGNYTGSCTIGCSLTVSTITFVNSGGCKVTLPFAVGTQTQTSVTSYCGGNACGGMFTTETITAVITTTSSGLCTPASNYVVTITIDP